MVERSLSMREVPGSMPGSSTKLFIFLPFCFFLLTQLGILIYKRLLYYNKYFSQLGSRMADITVVHLPVTTCFLVNYCSKNSALRDYSSDLLVCDHFQGHTFGK